MKIECPNCFHQMDQHACVTSEKHAPGPGDATLCIRCGAVLLYDEKGVTAADEDTQREILSNPAVAHLQRQIRANTRGGLP